MPVYTRPEKSWSVNEMATATLLNQWQRDNMSATLHRVAYKTVNETVTNDTTLQNDDHLFYLVYPNQTWYFKVALWCNQPSPVSFTCNLKLAFTFGTGSATMGAWTQDASSGLAIPSWTSSGTPQSLLADTVTTKTVHIIEGIHAFTGTVPTNFQVQWAQDTADTGGLTVYKGSTIWGVNVT